MPKLDGLSVLKAIRSYNKLRYIPVTMLTTSDQEEDRVKSYELGANAFVRKPIGFEKLAFVIDTINRFWEIVELPFTRDSRPALRDTTSLSLPRARTSVPLSTTNLMVKARRPSSS